jgi:competence protein ComEA
MQLPSVPRRRALAYAALVVALLVVGGRLLARDTDRDGGANEPSPVAPALVATSDSEPAREIVVHVAGAVRSPGLVSVPEGSRVADVLARAGGPRARAALELVNLAAPVSDGQQVLVPVRAAGTAAVAAATAAGPPAATGPVSLNSATVEQLDALPGVGPVTAQRIVDWRTDHGPFGSVDDLDAVPGIGPARLEQLRDLVTV